MISRTIHRTSLLFAGAVLAFQLMAQDRALTGTVFEADG